MAVVNLLDQMIALLQMELATEAEDVLNSLEDEGDSNTDDPLSLSDSNSPCLDILLSENIPAHILAASRMPVSSNWTFRSFDYVFRQVTHILKKLKIDRVNSFRTIECTNPL